MTISDAITAIAIAEDADRLGSLIGTSDLAGITAIVDKYPALLNLNLSEEAAFNFLSGAARELRRAVLAKAGRE